MRAFISIDLSPEVKLKIVKTQQRFKFLDSRIVLIPQANLHLTLKFLGDLSDETQPLLVNKLSGQLGKIKAFDMELAGGGVFPSQERIKIIWLGVKAGADCLNQLNEIISPICSDLGFKHDENPFVPHLTIGRVNWVNNRKALVDRVKSMRSDSMGIECVSKLYLKKSTLTEQGPIYETLAEFNLS